MAITSEHFNLGIYGGTGPKNVYVWPSGSKNNNHYDYKATGTVSDGVNTKTFKVYHFGMPNITTSASTVFPGSGGTIPFQVYSHYEWWFDSKPWWLTIKDANNNTINNGSVQDPPLDLDNPYMTVYMTAVANTTTSGRQSSNFRLLHRLRSTTGSAVTISVSQAGADVSGSITTPSDTTINCTGGTVYLDITVPQGVAWHLGNVNSNYGLKFYDPNGNEFNYWQDSQTGTGVSQRYSVVWPNYAAGTQDRTWTPSLIMVDSASGTGYRGIEAGFTFTQAPCALPESIMVISGLTNGGSYQIDFTQSERSFHIPYSITGITSAHTITITYPNGDRGDISFTGFPSTASVSYSGNTKTKIRSLGTGNVNSSFDLTVDDNHGGVRFIDVYLANAYEDDITTQRAGTIHLRQEAYFPGSISGTTYGSTRYTSTVSGASVNRVPYSAYVSNCQVVVEYDSDSGVEVITDKTMTKSISNNISKVSFFVGNNVPINDSFKLVLPQNIDTSLNFVYLYLYQGDYTSQSSDLLGTVRLQQAGSSGSTAPITVTYVEDGTWNGTTITSNRSKAHFDFVVKATSDWFINLVPTASTSNQRWVVNDRELSSSEFPINSTHTLSAGTYHIRYYQSGVTTAQTQMRLTSYKGSQQGWTVDGILAYQKGQNELCFNIGEDGGNIYWYTTNASFTRTIQYSKNGGAWTNITSTTQGASIPVSAGDKVRFKGSNSTYGGGSDSVYCHFYCDTTYTLSGYITSLIDPDNYEEVTQLVGGWNFFGMFYDNEFLVDAGDLKMISEKLAEYSYSTMFEATNIVNAPRFPLVDMVLAEGCCEAMFRDCPDLRNTPELHSRTLVQGCYREMFAYCPSVNTIICLAENPDSDSSALADWLVDAEQQGYFTCLSSAQWPTGDSGIPQGWMIFDYDGE